MRAIYINGKVYTGELPLVEAFVQEDGRFLYAGDNGGALEFKAEGTEVVDLAGRFVCAGFNDSHMHLLNFGYSLRAADLSRHTGSLEEVLEEMRRFGEAEKLSDGSWLRGRGWNQDYFEGERRFPNRYDLDRISTAPGLYRARLRPRVRGEFPRS